MMRWKTLLLCALALTARPLFAELGTSYWIWQRHEPLSGPERQELGAQHVTTLYWHSGEIVNNGGGWHWKKTPIFVPSDGDFRVVPVIRLESATRTPFDEEAVRGLTGLIQKFLAPLGDKKPGELQIDFDCPDRLLARYAEVLKKIHSLVPKLSITALGGWTKNAAWPALQASIDEIAPMFYDMEADPVGVSKDRPPLPLLDPRKIDAQLAEWRACKIPWFAGLPAFARVSLYDAHGKSRGHIRSFAWDDICFSRSLATLGATTLGTTLFRVESPARIADTPLQPGEFLATRWADRDALRHAINAAKQAGARGVIFFRLSGSTDPDGWTLPQIGAITSAEKPRLSLRITVDGKLQLTNMSSIDLPPRLSGEGGAHDRGYALEIDAPAPLWREALEGSFWRVTSHVNADTKPRAVPVLLGTRLTFWFSRLHADHSITSGLIRLAPGADPDDLRWRVQGLGGENSWRKLEFLHPN